MEAKLLTAERFVDKEAGCSYRYVYSDTEYFRPHYHDYFEIFLVLEGEALHKVNGVTSKLAKGDLVLIRPKDCHDYLSINGKAFSFLNITFTPQTVQMLFSYLGEGFPSQLLLNAQYPPEVHLSEYEFTRLERRMRTIRALDPTDVHRKKTELRMLLFDIFTRQFSNMETAEESIPLWLEEMCAEVKRNGGFTKDMEYFLSLTDRSREHVSRCMKKYMNMTASEYINSLRLNYIANMLKDSNHGISEIIYESGFNNISWASEQFKKKYGVSMSQYRKGIKL